MKYLQLLKHNMSGYNSCFDFTKSDDNLFDWSTLNCFHHIKMKIISGNTDNILFNKTNFAIVKNDIKILLYRYLTKYLFTNNKTSLKYNYFQEYILDFCSLDELGGICDEFLSKYCIKKTRNELIGNRVLTNLCGCYITPDPQILKVSKNPACDPMCNNYRNANKINLNTGNLQKCTSNVCIISNINISMYKTNAGVDINMLCNNCSGKDLCMCMIDNVNFDKNYKINQYCNKNSICMQRDERGVITKNELCESKPKFNKYVASPNMYIIIFMIIFLFIIIIIILLSVGS